MPISKPPREIQESLRALKNLAQNNRVGNRIGVKIREPTIGLRRSHFRALGWMGDMPNGALHGFRWEERGKSNLSSGIRVGRDHSSGSWGGGPDRFLRRGSDRGAMEDYRFRFGRNRNGELTRWRDDRRWNLTSRIPRLILFQHPPQFLLNFFPSGLFGWTGRDGPWLLGATIDGRRGILLEFLENLFEF